MGAVAPGRLGQKVAKTSVRRRPFWMPWGDDGAGAVVLLPADRTHTAMMVDEEGISEPYYQSKGFVPLNMLPADHEAHVKFDEQCAAAVEAAKAEQLPVPDWVPPKFSVAKVRARASKE